jgi:hypothetical protein
MDAANAAPMDYYLLPLIDLEIERSAPGRI